MIRRQSWRLTSTICFASLIACQSRPPEPPRLLRKTELSEAERRYGVAPRPDRRITYQPDVVVVKGGPAIVRAASGDGLTWTIDPRAPGAAALAPGKVMFVTGRAVGRVLALRRVPDGLAVTIGPVDLTEIVNDLELSLDQPLDLAEAVEYEAAAPPLAFANGRAPRAEPVLRPALYRGAAAPFVIRPAVQVHGFDIFAFNGEAGVGLSLDRNADGIRAQAGFVLALEKPHIYLDLKIHRGIQRAVVRVGGATAWRLTFNVASDSGVQGNVSEEIPVPKDWSIPVGGPGSAFPFAVTVRHVFIVKTAFSSRGNLKAVGGLKVNGELYAGYEGGQFRVYGPSFAVENDFMRSLHGVSLGAEGLVLAHEARVIVGVGAFDFVTGPYVGLRTALGVTQGSSIGLIQCKGGTIDSNITAGVGYSIPQPVTKAINAILRALNAGEISGHGALQAGTVNVFHAAAEPTTKLCRG